MKHLPFENWILNEPKLKIEELNILAQHLAICNRCRQLKTGWEASKILLTHSNPITPAPGFTARWHTTIIKKRKTEKVRRYRMILFGSFMLTFAASIAYMIASGSFLRVLANFSNTIIQSIIAITNSLSTLGLLINQLPAVVPITAGFFFFGLMNAFLMSAVFLFWNLKNKKTLIHETSLD